MRISDKLYIGILLVIFGGIVLHAPLSVFFGVQFPATDLFIKSWKEILMGVALVYMAVLLTVRKSWGIFRSNLFYLIAAFAVVNLVLIPAYFTGVEATIAGLFINLRYLLFFVLVYAAIRLHPEARRWFLWVFLTGAAVVIGFALLQLTVLPHDVLKYIGYGETTIAPFLTVDQNMDYIRINSTLRGPNPLGAYGVIVLAVLLAFWFSGPKKMKKSHAWALLVLGIGSVLAVWASYSRSAAVGALVAVGLVILVVYGRRLSKSFLIGLSVVMLVVLGSLAALKDTSFVSHVILHEDPTEGNAVNSNDGHAESLADGALRLLQQPLGAGIGSTGSASLFTENPVIIENQYLFVAHETGWFGLLLFLAMQGTVLWLLWKRRKDWLALGVFASGVGLLLVGLLLPVWVDDTVSIIWWGLAAIALASPVVVSRVKKGKK